MVATATVPEGLVKTVVKSGGNTAAPIGRGDIVTVKYTCYAMGGESGDDKKGVLTTYLPIQKVVVSLTA